MIATWSVRWKARAEDIVSGDQLLVRLGAYQGMPILTPQAFVEMLQRQPKPPAE
jgi:predicted nucleic acid-binding protein